jgi:hypothetical protein
MPLLAHASWQQHADDMYEVFGFERNEELTNWMRFVSSVLIDNNNSDNAFSKDGTSFNFYSYLQEKYPDFQCKHRFLFHWGYNSRPWSTYLQDKVNRYGWSEDKISNFQADLVAEQKRRNGFANEYTENVFGFAHGGKEARIARVLISIAYDVHILGDYEPDNSDLEGLQDMGSVVGDIINNLTALDKKRSSALSKQIRKVSQSQEYELQDKATVLLDLLKDNFSLLLQNANEGEIRTHLVTKGFRFTNYQGHQTGVEEQKPIIKQKNTKKKDTPQRSRNSGGFGIVIICSLAALGLLLVLLFKKHK